MTRFLAPIFTFSFFVCALTLPAQNLGITSPGTTNYPQTTIGNTLTEASNNAGNFLIFNPVTTTVPLTTISIRTFGSVSGTISVTIYNDNAGTTGDGSITVSGSGGVSPYTFSVDNGTNYLPPTGTNLRLFSGLVPGNSYKIRVKDNIGCESKSVQ